MNELMKIVEFVRTNSVTPRIALARMSLMVGIDVHKLSGNDTYPPLVEDAFRKAAREITGKSYH